MKGGVNSFRREHGDKCAKPMKVESSEDVPGEFCQVHLKRDVRILKGSLKGVTVSLGMSDPMEEVNKFMGDGVFTKEGGSLQWCGGRWGF